MKKAISAFIVIMTLAGSVQANELCGILTGHFVGPRCMFKRPCLEYVQVKFTITPPGEPDIAVHTDSIDVLQQMDTLVNTSVCAEGWYDGSGFAVISISAE